MDSVILREKVWDDLLTLPEDAFLAVREFVLFQKNRSGLSGVERLGRAGSFGRSTALVSLLKFKGTLARDVDLAMELEEALDEKHKRLI